MIEKLIPDSHKELQALALAISPLGCLSIRYDTLEGVTMTSSDLMTQPQSERKVVHWNLRKMPWFWAGISLPDILIQFQFPSKFTKFPYRHPRLEWHPQEKWKSVTVSRYLLTVTLFGNMGFTKTVTVSRCHCNRCHCNQCHCYRCHYNQCHLTKYVCIITWELGHTSSRLWRRPRGPDRMGPWQCCQEEHKQHRSEWFPHLDSILF